MAWTDIDNSLVSVGALPFATTIQALRDNPIAIANGDSGAPRIKPVALESVTSGSLINSRVADYVVGTHGGGTAFVIISRARASIGGSCTFVCLFQNSLDASRTLVSELLVDGVVASSISASIGAGGSSTRTFSSISFSAGSLIEIQVRFTSTGALGVTLPSWQTRLSTYSPYTIFIGQAT